MLQITVNNDAKFSVEHDEAEWTVDEQTVDCDIRKQQNNLISVIYNDKSYTAIVEKVDKKAKEVVLNIDGQTFNITIEEPMDQLLKSMGLDMSALQKAEPIKAPMPGKILKIMVEVGQTVSKGDGLLILEAMKMENVLKASGDATIKAINIEEQKAVEKGQILIELE